MKSKLFRFLTILFVVTGLGCVASGIWIGHQYVHTAPRFTLKKVTIPDLKRVEDNDVLSRIQLRTDRNTNIFAIDLEDVRARVEQIEWVHHVTVQRVLPDEIFIRVTEREPVGLARIQGHIYQFDAEAAILEPASPLPSLPVLLELNGNDLESNRRKIAMYRKVTEELASEDISQILVASNDEVSIVRNGDPLIVKLGVADFKDRWSRYLKLKEMINTSYKNAVRVDLRFRNKVIVTMQNDDDGGKVIWDGKKKSL